jgi:hypothetical protein
VQVSDAEKLALEDIAEARGPAWAARAGRMRDAARPARPTAHL